MTISVLLVDDQELVRAGFRMILEAENDIDVVGEAANGADAVDQVRSLQPDVVLMDVRMPEMDGIEATRHVGGQSRVIMLTTFDPDEYVYESLRAGASGFLLKDVPPEDLVAAIRVVAAGEALLAPSVTRRMIEDFARARPRPSSPPSGMDRLTQREREVLELLAAGRTNAEIAAQLFVSETTVKTHVSHIFTKLGLRDRAQAVVLAYESGLVQPGS